MLEGAPGQLSVTLEQTGSTVVMRLAGELDLATTEQVTAALDRIEIENTTRVVVDLQAIDFLDVSGLNAILRSNYHCREQGIRVSVVKPRGLASHIFTLTSAQRELDLIDAIRPWRTERA